MFYSYFGLLLVCWLICTLDDLPIGLFTTWFIRRHVWQFAL